LLNTQEALAIFGEPVTPREAKRLTSQRGQVETIMADGYWHTLPQLQRELKRRFGVLSMETSISARIRGMRRRGYSITTRRTRPGSGLFEYRAVKAAISAPILTDTDTHNEEQANAARIEAAL
jgi:hypothetical protein